MKLLVVTAMLVITSTALATDQIGEDAAKLAAERHSGRGHSPRLIGRMARAAADERKLEGRDRKWFIEIYVDSADDLTPGQVDRLRRDIEVTRNYGVANIRTHRQALTKVQQRVVQNSRHSASLVYGLTPRIVAAEQRRIRDAMASWSRVQTAIRAGHVLFDAGQLKLVADMPPALQPAGPLRPAF